MCYEYYTQQSHTSQRAFGHKALEKKDKNSKKSLGCHNLYVFIFKELHALFASGISIRNTWCTALTDCSSVFCLWCFNHNTKNYSVNSDDTTHVM